MARVIVGLRAYPPPPAVLQAAGEGRLAGLLWFRDAFGETVEEGAARVAALRRAWHPSASCIFMIDEEGGLIQQLSGLRESSGETWPRLPSPRALGRSGDPNLVRAHGREIGRRLRRLGLDVALAPTVDLDPGPASPVLGTRCFGDAPVPVAEIALAWTRGLASAGVRGCLKHYPGHGATAVDSHVDLPRVPRGVAMEAHREPYALIARGWRTEDGPAPAVLTAHIAREGIDLPASLDRTVLAVIPRGLGPIVTDSLDMGALAGYGDLPARGRAALDAGSDLLLVGLDAGGGVDLARALPDDRSARVDAWRGAIDPPEIPPSWSRVELDRAADSGLRQIVDGGMPEGEWDWILPERWGAYGAVAAPSVDTPGTRRIGRILRYRTDDPSTLDRALASAVGPALVGWIHRGPEDHPTRSRLERAGSRVRAIIHLLDGPSQTPFGSVWTVETCGFGEGEMTALARRWAAHRAS
jgi:beta-glucosidase-like glycosyl hydrolase